MGKEVHYTFKRGSHISEEEIAMIEVASNLPAEHGICISDIYGGRTANI